jgi:putative protein-disulfide isomerase
MKITIFTDPICSTCWAMEAEVRKIKAVFDDQITWSMRMGGLLKNWAEYDGTHIRSPKDVGKHWDEVGEKYKVPISAGIWEDAPLISSYPACIAVKSAQLTSPEHAETFLRSMRELLFVGMYDINSPNVIEKAAIMSGISPAPLFDNMQAAKTTFNEDMQFAKLLGIRVLPTFILEISGNVEILRGYQTYDSLLAAIMRLGYSRLNPTHKPDFSKICQQFESLTAREVSIYLDIEHNQAEAMLETELQYGTFQRVPADSGALYHKKASFFHTHPSLLRSEQKSIIIGAGVAGLGAAMVMEKNRIPYQVYESLPDRSMHMLTGMVITDEVFSELETNGFPLSCLSPETQLKSILQIQASTGERNEHPLRHHYAIDRMALLDALSEYSDKSKFNYNQKLSSLAEDCCDLTQAVFSNGETYNSEYIFGTDGVHSKVREAVLPELKIRRSAVYEILVPFESISIQQKLKNRLIKVQAVDKGFNIGLLGLGKGKNLIYIQINTHKIPLDNQENLNCDIYKVIEMAVDEFNKHTEEMLADLRYNRHYLWKTSDMDIPHTFNKGNVMVMGDAAHTFLPFTSQGACSAIMDSLTLHKLLNTEKHNGRLSPELLQEVYEVRKDDLQKHLDFGRELENRFLYPEKYGAQEIVPFSK